ncbi:MAG: ACP S-malonyltransferase [Vicinamibacterales bacterium]|jgi:[acyl-carrier-protein] S-malonyltransferase|nr:ACP S-malonyltransferase [Vicinamibacterales bacterium]MDP7472787.1 ACP S-malonyltransferase [Vicinamibacterales bacterium]MDP7672680.1 ACP S-malonyltransferase [Vicinamibacterales bacterium]HJO38886.1 ACP S-malonyltransferase [Vicinamibacterales bacterium]|tara:strand:- start:3779 stop:4705 length:927 start_codon:yes stop_codon:yes gene_type:complete
MLAFIFPGQGSQRVGMGRDLAETYPECRATFQEADDVLGESLSTLCFDGPEDRLTLTENAQPAILTASVAMYRGLTARGLAPACVAGHSLGEYSAHVAAGTMAFADALGIVRRRGRYMQEAVPVGEGAMAAVLGLDADEVGRACADSGQGEVVSPANLNAPDQVVIAGAREAVGRAGEASKRLGAKRVVPLTVSAPFHCALMQPAADRLAPELRALEVADPTVPVVANVDAQPKLEAAEAIEALIGQIASPVLWEQVVKRLASDGADTYLEVGPGSVLTGLMRKIDRSLRAVAADSLPTLDHAKESIG